MRYTQSSDWTDAVNAAGKDGKLLHRLINGLEDPRIEQCIITSGHCANARVLFESLLSSVLLKDYAGGDYVEPNDVGNIAFQLAVEGRRLNGYSIPCPPVYQRSKYRRAIERALKKGNACTSTSQIIEVARELLAAIKCLQSEDDQQDQPQDQPQDKDQPSGDGDDQSGDSQDGDGDGDGQGSKGQKGSGDDGDGDDGGSGDADADDGDGGKAGGGSGKGDRSIEPSESIGNVFKDANAIDGFIVPRITSVRKKLLFVGA